MRTSTRLSRRARAAALCGALLALALPGAAHASIAKVTTSGGSLAVVYTASGGETNRVTVTQVGDVYTIVDPGAVINPGTGCLAAASTATCTAVGAYQVKVYSEDQDDTVVAALGLRTKLYGGTGNDVLRTGASADDLLDGGDGDDRLASGAGADVLRGGVGSDTADYSDRISAVSADPDNNADDGVSGEGDDIEPTVEGAIGGAGGDALAASDAGGFLSGGGGNDRLRGGAGSDLVDGGLGSDELRGEGGDDTLRSRDVAGEEPDCGDGTDRAEVDPLDRPVACENAESAILSQEELDSLLSSGSGSQGDGGAAPGDAPGQGEATPPGTEPSPENSVLLPARPLTWEAPGVALVTLQCAATAVDGCRGEIILEITERVPRRSRAVAARGRHTARQQRVGSRRFRAGSGKRIGVRIRLNARGHAILRNRRRARGQIRIKHRDAAGRVTGETTRPVVFTARKWGRRTPRRSR